MILTCCAQPEVLQRTSAVSKSMLTLVLFFISPPVPPVTLTQNRGSKNTSNRVDLASPVAAGASVALNFNETAPATAGTCNFQWQMTQGGARFGALTPNVPVNVTVETAGAQLYFIHTDHLNTPRLITNDRGRLIGGPVRDPFRYYGIASTDRHRGGLTCLIRPIEPAVNSMNNQIDMRTFCRLPVDGMEYARETDMVVAHSACRLPDV